MPEPLSRFLETAQDNNVDDALLEAPVVKRTLHNLENFGKDLGESAEKILKRPPVKPAGPTPTYKESAFVKPKSEGTLYNVTNREDKLPIVTKASKFIKDASYGIRGLTASAKYKDYSLYAGEKVGLGWSKEQGATTSNIKAEYNVGNGKTKIEYSRKNPINSYNISLFNQDGNNGISAGYSNSNGFNSAFSIDQHSASLRCGYDKKYDNCNIELDAYATTGDKYSNPFAGVAGRITF